MQIERASVVGAGKMGGGIAQRIATAGYPVTLIDTSQERAEAGWEHIQERLQHAVTRGVMSAPAATAAAGRITPSGDLAQVRQADVVVEAVFEDPELKEHVFTALGHLARPEALLATNTSTCTVADLAAVADHPARVLGLHFCYPPERNRLVEVVAHRGTDARAISLAWAWQERLGLLPIRAMDAPGFVVNRFFLPWLNEAVRLHQEGYSLATVEWTARRSFGVPLGPFGLMNAAGVPLAYQVTRALGGALGAFYAPAPLLEEQAARGVDWLVEGDPDELRAEEVAQRLWGVVLHVALELVSEGVAAPGDVDQGATVGLRWPTGPFEKMARLGASGTRPLTHAVERLYGLWEPANLGASQEVAGPAHMH